MSRAKGKLPFTTCRPTIGLPLRTLKTSPFVPVMSQSGPVSPPRSKDAKIVKYDAKQFHEEVPPTRRLPLLYGELRPWLGYTTRHEATSFRRQPK